MLHCGKLFLLVRARLVYDHACPQPPVCCKNCSNVRELSLPTTKLNMEQLKGAVQCMGQLATLCLNFQGLNLSENGHCLKSLQGLRAIANGCDSLQLNLSGIKVTDVEDHMQLWEILSDMKLTHLTISLCLLVPLDGDDTCMQNFIILYEKFSHL